MPANITHTMRDPSPAQVVADRAALGEAWRRAEKGSGALLAALHKHHPGRDRHDAADAADAHREALRLVRASRQRVAA
jgi:hypothetical protein